MKRSDGRLYQLMSSASEATGDYEIHFLDVGQGNSTVVILPPKIDGTRDALVIDSANSATTIDCLKRCNVTHIRLILITHSDSDHALGIPGVLSEYSGNITTIAYNLDRNNIGDKSWQKKLDRAINNQSADRVFRTVDEIQDANMYLTTVSTLLLTDDGIKYGEVLYPHPEDLRSSILKDDPNHACAVVSIWFNNFKALLGSDLTLKGWSVLCSRIDEQSQLKLQANLFQFPHHGAALEADCSNFIYNGRKVEVISALELLKKINPEIVLISVGTQQPTNYEHPRASTFDLLKNYRRLREQEGKSLRVACTELTSRCMQNPLRMREIALSWLFEQDRSISYADKPSSAACPCCGTFSVYIPSDGSQYRFQPDEAHQVFIDKVQQAGGTPGCRLT